MGWQGAVHTGVLAFLAVSQLAVDASDYPICPTVPSIEDSGTIHIKPGDEANVLLLEDALSKVDLEAVLSIIKRENVDIVAAE